MEGKTRTQNNKEKKKGLRKKRDSDTKNVTKKCWVRQCTLSCRVSVMVAFAESALTLPTPPTLGYADEN